MQLKRARQSSAFSPRCAIGALRRWQKPLVLVIAIAATASFYSCKKFDPRECLARKMAIEDTAACGKKKFINIGPRAFADETPMADTLLVVPLKRQSEVVMPKQAR